MLLLTLRGTPTMYYGDELGMTDVPIPPEQALDPYERRVPGRGVSRDPERTPMQWTAGAHAGFCPPDAQPWLPVAEDHHRVNVTAEQHDPRSVLALYRRLLALRRGNHALTGGAYRAVRAAGGDGLPARSRRRTGARERAGGSAVRAHPPRARAHSTPRCASCRWSVRTVTWTRHCWQTPRPRSARPLSGS